MLGAVRGPAPAVRAGRGTTATRPRAASTTSSTGLTRFSRQEWRVVPLPLTVKLWFYFQVCFLNSYSIEYWLISLIDNRPNYYSILTFLIWFLIRLLIRFLHRYLIPFPIRFLIRFLILFLIWFLIRYLIPFPIRFLIRFLPLGLLWFLLWMFPWLEYFIGHRTNTIYWFKWDQFKVNPNNGVLFSERH